MTEKREPWQEAPCYYTGGICQANCAPACMCQNGALATELTLRNLEFDRATDAESPTSSAE